VVALVVHQKDGSLQWIWVDGGGGDGHGGEGGGAGGGDGGGGDGHGDEGGGEGGEGGGGGGDGDGVGSGKSRGVDVKEGSHSTVISPKDTGNPPSSSGSKLEECPAHTAAQSTADVSRQSAAIPGHDLKLSSNKGQSWRARARASDGPNPKVALLPCEELSASCRA
jgi:hypothetical protein